jgi:hypothetical protein
MKVLTDELGAQAIIDLQRMTGITETQERADAGWQALGAQSRRITHQLHTSICGGFAEPKFVELTEWVVTKAGTELSRMRKKDRNIRMLGSV